MKKVAIFYKSYQKYGGQEKVIWKFSRYLAENGYRVDIYTVKVKDRPQNDNIRVKKVFVPNLGVGLKTLIFALYAYKKAKRINDAVVFGFGKTFYQDIYKSDGGVHKYYFKRAQLKYTSKIARAFYVFKKTLSLSHWANIWIEKRTFEDSRLKTIVVPSVFVKRQILSEFKNVDEKKIKVIRNDVTVERFDYNKKDEVGKNFRSKTGISDSMSVFCFVSTNHRLKGLEYLLEACRIVKREGYEFRLIIAGNGGESYFKKMIKRYGLSEDVKWLGVVKDIENVYYASDFFVYPTLFDTFGFVVLESMACGTPVFCSQYAGASEIIDDKNFIISDPTNCKEIADRIIYALKNKDMWQNWRIKAHNTARKYSTDTSSKQLMRLLEELNG